MAKIDDLELWKETLKILENQDAPFFKDISQSDLAVLESIINQVKNTLIPNLEAAGNDPSPENPVKENAGAITVFIGEAILRQT